MLHRRNSYARRKPAKKTLALGLLTFSIACGQTEPVGFDAGRHTETMTQGAQVAGETWALEWVIPVRWAKNLGMQAGEGQLVHHAKSIATAQGSTRYDQVRLCGVQQPSYKLQRHLGKEEYGPQYPAALFDAEALPTHTMVTHLGEAGTFTTEAFALQLGVALDDPEHAPWPEHHVPLPGSLAQQADGKPGFATHMRTDGPFVMPPVNMLRTRRAHTFHVAMRHLVGACGFQTHDGHWEGCVQVAGIGGKAALNLRVLGCDLEGGAICTASELINLNSFHPKYVVTGRGRFVMQRISAETTCEDIRAMDFAQ